MNLLSPNASALAPDARRTTSAHIPQDEKDEIRRYVSEAGDDDETERRREECAELYGVTVQVIIAIVAWKKIREQRGASGSGRGTAISDGPPLEEGSVGFSDAAPLDPPRAAALRTDTAAKVDDIAQLDSSVREDIVAQMRDALGDPDELPYVDDNIAALAQRYGVSAWTIELLSGRNIPRARQIIESVRANVRSALAFEGIAQIAQTRGTAPSSPAIDHAGAAPIGTTVSTPSEGLRNVDDDAKSHIRAYVAAGENTDEKKRRRREMAERYGLTIYQVAAITAWTIIDEKRAAAAGTISKNDSIPVSALPDAAVTTVPTGTDPADSAPREIGQASDVAEDSEFDEGPLLDLAAWFDFSDPEDAELFSLYARDAFPDMDPASVSQFIERRLSAAAASVPSGETARPARGEGLGALIDYDTPIKNVWRAKVSAYVDENTDRAKRATMKVLCLPGVECLEIPMYLDLGFRPENIIGVEAGIVNGKVDHGVRERFLRNAERYGIRAHVGRLEAADFLKKEIFDVVSLDFTGPFSKLATNVLESLTVAPKGVVVTNFQAKRESDQIQDDMEYMNRFRYGGTFAKPYDTEPWKEPRAHSKHHNEPLFEKRASHTIAGIIVSTVWQSAPPSRLGQKARQVYSPERIEELRGKFEKNDNEYAPGEFDWMLSDAWVPYIHGLFEDLGPAASWNGFPEREKQMFLACIGNFVKTLLISRRAIVSHRMYSYMNGSTPMITDCLTIGAFDHDGGFGKFRRSAEFLLQLVDEILKDFGSGREDCELVALDKNMRPLDPYVQRDRTDVIVLRRNGRTVTKIEMKRFGEEIIAAMKITFANGFATERERIELPNEPAATV